MSVATRENEIIRLRSTFTRDGFSYKQIWKDGDVAVYEYNSRGGSFEVVVIRREPERVKFGKLTPPMKYIQRQHNGNIWLEFRAKPTRK